jgi:protein involved in polysaccharide export with SLBB domain
MIWKGWISAFILLLLASTWQGCELLGFKPPPPDKQYVCKDDVILLGDTLTISLLDIPDPPLERQYVVRADGTLNMFRLGPVPAAGKTFSDFEREMKEAYLAKGLYRQITLVVKPGDRFYTVAGEVKNGTRLVYQGSTTVLRAIASVGDFTDFANRTSVEITRADGKREVVDCKYARKHSEYDRVICPGDYIFVPKSSF